MENKQIIIDGVDVSGCFYYEENPKYRMWGTCDCMRTMVDQSGYDELAGAECKGYNCYYKQKEKYKNALKEIREIAEEQQSWNEWNSKHSETESEDDIFAYNCSALKQILQKINEVLNA